MKKKTETSIALIIICLTVSNCCKVTIINSDCLYGRYSCNNPCLIPPFICDSTTRSRCDTVSILIDHDTWRHYYRAKDTLPASYYDMHPKDRIKWEKGKARTLGYSNGSGWTRIDSMIFEDTSIAKIISADYSQKTWDGAKILISKNKSGDLPITVWTEKGTFLSNLHITDSSLTSEQVCKRVLSRDKGISPFWLNVGVQAMAMGITLAITTPLMIWYKQTHGK